MKVTAIFESIEDIMEFTAFFRGQGNAGTEDKAPTQATVQAAPAPAAVPVPTAAPAPAATPVPAAVPVSQAAPAYAAPTAVVAPAAQAAVPTSTPQYKLDDLARAAMALLDSGRQADLQGLLARFGVDALPRLPQEQYGAFATALREMGAQI